MDLGILKEWRGPYEFLWVNNVSKTYGSKAVVDTITFEAKPGEITGILGPNGAGKTTMIRMIMGITAPDSGEILFSFGQVESFKCS